MSKFAILLGGPVQPTSRLKAQLSGLRVIAADGGIAHAAALGLQPELWVGDFDSTPDALQQVWQDVSRQQHPVEKDASDGELAVTQALRLGATGLVLVGGSGGQLDHQLAHIGMLVSLGRRGIEVMMTTGTEETWPLAHKLDLQDLPEGSRLSVMPLTDLTGLTISGVKWPLKERNVVLGSALTLANIVHGPVEMALRGGQAIVVAYPT